MTPAPAVVLLLPVATGTGYNRRGGKVGSPRRPPRLPRQRPQPIPDRAAFRERVTRLLRETRPQRDDLKAAAQSWAAC
jgi:hypothetical protein